MWRVALMFFVATVYGFLLLPIVMTLCASLTSSPVLAFPPSGFTFQWYRRIPSDYLAALQVSLMVAAGTTAIATLVGTPAALALVRGRFIGRDLLNIICLSPLMTPTLVIGVAAFQFALRLSDFIGVSGLGTIPGIILAQTAFTIPFVIRAAITGHAHFDAAVEEAAMTLGATPFQTFFRVTLPILAPGITSGAIFSLIMSLDDVPVSLFVGGGDATTLPVKIFTSIEFSFGSDVMAVSSILVGLSIVLMIVLDRIFGLDKFFGLTRE
jgi:putative spermidine/putrescine transport system permease protein